jgi:hypothetical protein
LYGVHRRKCLKEIGIDERNISEIETYNSAFGIALHKAIPGMEKVRFYFCENGYTTIPFFSAEYQ